MTGRSTVGVSGGGRTFFREVLTRVLFRRLGQEDIARYLATEDWRGKAGSYGIQGPAGAFIPWIAGSYTAVMGLPMGTYAESRPPQGVLPDEARAHGNVPDAVEMHGGGTDDGPRRVGEVREERGEAAAELQRPIREDAAGGGDVPLLDVRYRPPAGPDRRRADDDDRSGAGRGGRRRLAPRRVGRRPDA